MLGGRHCLGQALGLVRLGITLVAALIEGVSMIAALTHMLKSAVLSSGAATTLVVLEADALAFWGSRCLAPLPLPGPQLLVLSSTLGATACWMGRRRWRNARLLLASALPFSKGNGDDEMQSQQVRRVTHFLDGSGKCTSRHEQSGKPLCVAQARRSAPVTK